MARWTDQGVQARSLDEYRGDLEGVFRQALGADLDVSGDSPQGQLIGLLATSFAEVDEAIVATGNAFGVQVASGRQLDDLCSLLGVRRIVATRSTVEVTITGRAGVAVPVGWQVRTPAGDVFRLRATVTVGVGGTVTGSMESVEPGAVQAAAGALTSPVDVLAGVESVTNAAAAAPGLVLESDTEFRRRYAAVVALNARGYVAAVRAAVLGVAGVTWVSVRENDTAATVTVQGVAIASHSLLVLVSGGAAAAVAAAILRTKGAGTGTVGTTTVQAAYAGETTTHEVRFSRPVEVPCAVTVTGVLRDGFPSDGVAAITAGVVDYVAARGAGEGVVALRLAAAAASAAAGWDPSAVTLTRKEGALGVTTADLTLTDRLTLAAADVTVTLTS